MSDLKDYEGIEESVAIIGMAGRFPGAKDINAFWQNIKTGVESIAFFSDQTLLSSGIDAATLAESNYVKAKGALAGVADFDAGFFDFSPREAEITDPQHRLFLECAWTALEHAGYNSKTYPGAIGVYGGVGGADTYLLKNLYSNPEIRKTVGDYAISLGNDKDFLCTRVSYKLNLRGPSVTVQTACSTSLVAVVMGCQSLLDYQCDMVLAGGVSITLPEKAGYWYQEGMIHSPDGHCRAFDAKAKGTVIGNGAGIVVLKRLSEALAHGDYIHAVIKGSAINNDGLSKVGYTAPSVNGQAQAILEAMALADVSPETITYVEAHGTGTALGDPIEIEALTQAFRTQTPKKTYCAIGSVKTNIGHLDVAAGVTGLIKTVMALKHQLLPPSLHFESPNPKIDFANSPFYVNAALSDWKTDGFPRRAGVSSFGMGGTNAHVVLEEATIHASQPSKRQAQLLLLSAKTETALATATTQLLEYLKQHPEINLADVAYTYQVGRCVFAHRRMLVCQASQEAVEILETQDTKRIHTHTAQIENPLVVFMFSGQGAQYVNMALELYQTEPVFRRRLDYCAEFLKPYLALDFRPLLYPGSQPEVAAQQLKQTAITQPVLFAIEYALAQLWMAWGVRPQAMIGHSIGEYVAACLAEVLSLEDALTLVAERGRLMQSLPAGTMLAVSLAEETLTPLLNSQIDLATVNTPASCVVSGPTEAIDQLATQLAEQGIECQPLHTSHAFHSHMMTPILLPFLEQVRKVKLNPPKIPYISNVTGTWISAAEATDPHYWAEHIRQTVWFAKGLKQLFKESKHVLLEVGPGRTLTTFAKRHPDRIAQPVFSSLRHPQEQQSDTTFLLNALGQLWLSGVSINWSTFHQGEQRYRLPLPTYPFERQRYWVEARGEMEHALFKKEAAQEIQSNESSEEKITYGHLRPHLENAYVAPRNQIEQEIINIWKDLFGISQIGIHDDFFALGGDSLLAVQVIAKLQEVFGRKLSPHKLLKMSTVADLANIFKENVLVNSSSHLIKQASSLLVEIQAGQQGRTPFFLIHPISGDVYIYQDLARSLDPEQPIYGLKAQGLDRETQPLTQVSEMAEQYIAALRAIQPDGPYFLGGASFGGIVAFEMAQQLCTTDQEIALLTLIDTPDVRQIPSSTFEKDDADILTYLLRINGNMTISAEQIRRLSGPSEQLAFYLKNRKVGNNWPITQMTLEQFSRYIDIHKANYRALRNYAPKSYSGKIIFFKATDWDGINPQHSEYGWHELAIGGIEVYEILGNHITMNYLPYVEAIAKRLKAYLNEGL